MRRLLCFSTAVEDHALFSRCELPWLEPPTTLPHGFWGSPKVSTRIKCLPEDFQVEEKLGYALDGDGDHVWLRVAKRNVNTDWIAGRLARLAEVAVGNVGFAGLKDRRALTTQWFSVLVANRPEPNWRLLDSDDLTVLEVLRHRRKLRRGGFQTNEFKLRLRDLQGPKADLLRRLERVSSHGVPNYFGPQRFGRDGNNLRLAHAMLTGLRPVRSRHQRGLYLSAVRAFLFNRVLGERVTQGTWNRALAGDVMMLDGTHSIFALAQSSDVVNERLVRQDIHPTGPLCGRGESLAQGQALALESAVLAPYWRWCQRLEGEGLSGSRRALRLAVKRLRYWFEGEHTLYLQFVLSPGSYATTVLRELVSIR